MSTTFVVRHPAAIAWVKKQPIKIDHWTEFLEIAEIKKGDTVIGILPMHLAAQVCAKGAQFIALCLDIPSDLRGKELTLTQLESLSCHLQAYSVTPLSKKVI